MLMTELHGNISLYCYNHNYFFFSFKENVCWHKLIDDRVLRVFNIDEPSINNQDCVNVILLLFSGCQGLLSVFSADGIRYNGGSMIHNYAKWRVNYYTFDVFLWFALLKTWCFELLTSRTCVRLLFTSVLPSWK